MSSSSPVAVVGGGAAGFFAAIACAEAGVPVVLLEQGPRFLAKVRISGGGRCNVTNVIQDPRELARKYPRGGRALIGPFNRFGSRETVEWFARRGVRLHAERDGRMFPVTNNSQTVIDCLLDAARDAGVDFRTNAGVRRASRWDTGFELELTDGSSLQARRLCVAVGGCRSAALGRWIEDLGHTVEPPVPSLFTFHIEAEWLRRLQGVSVETVDLSVPGTKLRERGPVLVTHWGLSGPAILRLSAWGARELHERDYAFPLRIDWLNGRKDVLGEFQQRRDSAPAKVVSGHAVSQIPGRLWEALVSEAEIPADTRWSNLTREHARRLEEVLTRTELEVRGKSLNKDEFVTCGGVRLKEVDFRTMESRIVPGLHFAGEILDIDGITGGFNFQAAWTTGWTAGQAMANR